MNIQRINEITTPAVAGQFYLVPMVFGEWFSRSAWWPVMGSLHEDTKFFSFPIDHFHMDRRFLVRDRDQRYAVSYPLTAQREGSVPLSDVVWKRRKCVRPDMHFPYWASPVQEMQSALAGTRCKAGPGGLICPHRGFALGSLVVDKWGALTCPMHGLRVEAATGLVMPGPAQKVAGP